MRNSAFIPFLLLALDGALQITHPKASPVLLTEREVGLSKITGAYSRLAPKGMTIFGQLVPYGRFWRIRAFGFIKLTWDSYKKALVALIPKGRFTTYYFPEEDAYTIRRLTRAINRVDVPIHVSR